MKGRDWHGRFTKGHKSCLTGKRRPDTSDRLRGKTGPLNQGWKGGRWQSAGYIFIYSPNHPFCDKKGNGKYLIKIYLFDPTKEVKSGVKSSVPNQGTNLGDKKRGVRRKQTNVSFTSGNIVSGEEWGENVAREMLYNQGEGTYSTITKATKWHNPKPGPNK
jgi:hypothetical protein